MSEHTNNNIPLPEPAPEEPVVKPRRFKALNIIGFSLLGIVALIAILLCAATYYLSPERLEKLIAEAASDNLNAEVTVSQPRFTIWSSLPNLRVEIDSVRVISHSLRGIPEDLRSQIPDNADFLMSSGKIKGNINIFKLIKGEIHLGDIEAEALNLNMVMVSDSIANFNILKDKTSSGDIPYFSARKIALVNPGKLRFYNHSARVSADLDLNTLTALRNDTDNNSYKADIKGNLNLNMGGKQLLSNFPIHLHGMAGLAFSPMTVRLSDFNIDLGKLRGVTNLVMTVEGEQKIDSFDYKLLETPVSDILSLLPEGMVKWPEALKADPEIGIEARLTAPYSLNSSRLPSAEASLSIPEGKLSYKEEGLPLLNIGYSPIEAKLKFDGAHPDATIVAVIPFTINGEGAEITISPDISDISTDAHLKLELNGKYDAASASRYFSALGQYALKGILSGNIFVDLLKSDIDNGNYKNINVDADFTLKNFSSKVPGEGIKIFGDSVSFTAKGNAGDLKMNIGSHKMSVTQGEYVRLNLNNLTADLSAKYFDKPLHTKAFKIPNVWNADSLGISYARHDNRFLISPLSKKFTNVINHWKPNFDIKIKSGSILTPVLPLHNDFHDFDLQASFDDINLKSLKMNAGDTRLHMAGKVSDLRRFLTSRTPVPLNLDFNLQIDTVFINQLAGAYDHGLKYTHGPSASFLTVIPDTLVAADTITMLLPRNVNANVAANIMMTKYSNIHLHNLGTGIILKDGNLKIKDLQAHSDFGTLDLNFIYNTADIESLAMKLNGGLKDVDVVTFFRNFHTLELMMPEMKNVAGNLSLGTDANWLLFPNMYINLPSVTGDIYLKGRDLTIHEPKNFHKYLKLVLHGTDINIADLDVHSSIHNNLIEVNPFNLDVQRYRLKVGGVANFDGGMYFHVGVDKSPVPFPFGVSISGSMKHPKIHLGGTSFNPKDAQEVTSSFATQKKVNLLLELQCILRELLAKAAEDDKTPSSSYVY